MALADAEIARHARQLLLPGLGEAGQERLKSARVRVVAAGPAAGPALAYLALAGIGTVWVDELGVVVPSDVAGWVWSPEQVGTPRASAAALTLEDLTGFVQASIYPPGATPTAVLVVPESQDRARAIAEEGRRAGLPHVVAESNAQGGAVVSVPVGGPCYACAALPMVGGAPSPADAAALGALAALEVVLLVAGAGQEPRARRIDLVRGQTFARPTSRQPGCACGAPVVSEPGAGGAGAP